jgi:hypothetical protein
MSRVIAGRGILLGHVCRRHIDVDSGFLWNNLVDTFGQLTRKPKSPKVDLDSPYPFPRVPAPVSKGHPPPNGVLHALPGV